MYYILKDMPQAGAVVILVILALFVCALVTMFTLCGRYRLMSRTLEVGDWEADAFLSRVEESFAAAYKENGAQTNTPGIISCAMGSGLSRLLLLERFLNNAVSLFVTLGLFGTFLGLSLSVSSLTKLIGFSNTSEWLSVLDSVGGGLMSALSGMGVAFYTSLAGAGCSIILTLLRTIFNPQSQREKLATELELWLDHDMAPTLPGPEKKDDAALVHEMIGGLNQAADSMEKTLNNSSRAFQKTLDEGSAALQKTLDGSRPYLVAFHQTVDKFNTGVRDFGEIDYNLRGTIERLDVAARDLVSAVRQTARNTEKGAGV